MGHKTGLRRVGAKGKSAVLPVLTEKELAEAQEGGEQLDIKKMAMEHVELSIRTLVTAQKSTLTKRQIDHGAELAPWSVRRAAARDLLEMAGGRPETREPEIARAGLTVIINKISTGERFEKLVPGLSAIERFADAVDAEVVERSEGE